MSGIKGFPTQQKLVNNQSARHEFVTVQPATQNLRSALDTVARYAFRVNSASIARIAGATTGNPSDGSGTIVDDLATPAQVGDFVRFEDGQAQFLELPIIEVSTNSFKLGCKLGATQVPSAGDSFFILRYVTQQNNPDGTVIISLANKSAVGLDRLVASVGSPITTAAYTTLVAATASVTEIEIDNTTGKTLVLAIGPAAGEVDTIYIPTKGLSRQGLVVPIGSRLSVKAMGGNATFGEVNVNMFA